MVIKTAHKSVFGSMLDAQAETDADGYIEYVDDPLFATLLDSELHDLAASSKDVYVRNAAVVESMARSIENWRQGL